MKTIPPARLQLTDADGLANFTDSALLVLTVSRQEIESGNVSSILERLHVVAESRESALRYRECLVLHVDGYDSDTRELPEIPEVRAFFAKLSHQWPHWLWFLHRNVGAIPLLLALLCQVQIHRSQGRFGTEFVDHAEMIAVVNDLFHRGNALFYAFGITAAEAQASAESAVNELIPGY